jgi:hypothetical protein
MSIVYTADVFCDGDACSIWTHGATSTKLPTKKEARAAVDPRAGWKHVGGKDYCPTCVKKMKH